MDRILYPNFKFIHNNKSDSLDLLLHGAGQGINSSLMVKLLHASEKAGRSVVSVSFPFLDRGDEKSSGPELLEEIEVVKKVLEFCRAEEYTTVRIIGKSLGGIIAAHYLATLPVDELARYELAIFGYVSNDTGLNEIMKSKVNLPNRITVIQGSKDKFGDIEQIKEGLKNPISKGISYF